MATPALDCGLITILLDRVVDDNPVPKDPLPPDKQPSNNPAPLVSGMATKNEILHSYQEKFRSDYPNPIKTNY